MIIWQFGPCSVCTSHIGSVGSRVIWYTQLIYTLLWNEKSHLLLNLGSPRFHNRERPCGRLWFDGGLDPNVYVPAILGPWVQGLFGTYNSYTRLTVELKSRTWHSLGYCRSHKRERPSGRFWLHGSLDPVFYVPAILGLWVEGLFGP